MEKQKQHLQKYDERVEKLEQTENVLGTSVATKIKDSVQEVLRAKDKTAALKDLVEKKKEERKEYEEEKIHTEDKEVTQNVEKVKEEYKDVLDMLKAHDWIDITDVKELDFPLDTGEVFLRRSTLPQRMNWEYDYEANEWLENFGKMWCKIIPEHMADKLLKMSEFGKDLLGAVDSKITQEGNDNYVYRSQKTMPEKSDMYVTISCNFTNYDEDPKVKKAWDKMTDFIR